MLGAAFRAESQLVTGHAELKGFGYADRTVETDPWLEGWHTLLVKAEGRVGKIRYAASVRAEAISSAERGDLAFDLADRRTRRSPLSVREAWVGVPLGSLADLELGRFELGWGKTDGYSPADAFLPRDLSDPYADEKLPLWGARLRAQKGPLRVEAVVSPFLTPWRLPPLSGRWAPVESGTPLLRVTLVDGNGEPPTTGFGALRLLGTIGDWDVGIWGRAGVRPAPLLVVRADLARPGPAGIEIPVDRRWAREEGAGVEVSRVVGSFVLRAEAAALFSADPGLGDALIWTVGAERAFGDGTLLVTFAANGRGTPVEPALLMDRAFLPALIVAWTRTEEWGSWRVVWTQGLAHRDGLVKVELTEDLADAWRAVLGVDYPYGSRFGPLGARPDSRRLTLAVRRSW